MKPNDGAIGGKRGLIIVSLLIVVVLLAVNFAPVAAGLRERIEYRRFTPRVTATMTATLNATPTALPYPGILPTYTPVLIFPYPTPSVCPFWWWCATQ